MLSFELKLVCLFNFMQNKQAANARLMALFTARKKQTAVFPHLTPLMHGKGEGIGTVNPVWDIAVPSLQSNTDVTKVSNVA